MTSATSPSTSCPPLARRMILVGLRVSFQSEDPKLAMRITERRSYLDLRDRETQALGQSLFLDAGAGRRPPQSSSSEAGLERQRASNPRQPLSQADSLLPYASGSRIATGSCWSGAVRYQERREPRAPRARPAVQRIGRVFPERPIGPSRGAVNIAGALAGLGLGFVLVGVRGASRGRGDASYV